jgi:plastocyanin
VIRSFPLKLAASLAAGALLLAACGDDDAATDTGAAPGTRTIEIDMQDIEFSPASVDVEAGETVRFVFHNRGAVVHDAFVGDEAAQDDHEMEMREGDDGAVAWTTAAVTRRAASPSTLVTRAN